MIVELFREVDARPCAYYTPALRPVKWTMPQASQPAESHMNVGGSHVFLPLCSHWKTAHDSRQVEKNRRTPRRRFQRNAFV